MLLSLKMSRWLLCASFGVFFLFGGGWLKDFLFWAATQSSPFYSHFHCGVFRALVVIVIYVGAGIVYGHLFSFFFKETERKIKNNGSEEKNPHCDCTSDNCGCKMGSGCNCHSSGLPL